MEYGAPGPFILPVPRHVVVDSRLVRDYVTILPRQGEGSLVLVQVLSLKHVIHRIALVCTKFSFLLQVFSEKRVPVSNVSKVSS